MRRARGRGAYVLVVDDYVDNREMYAEYLTFAGYEVAVAADGEEALQMVAARVPDVIVMDMGMPKLDGAAVTRRLKAHPRTSRTCVLAVTGQSGAEARERAMLAGCDDFLSKPCLPQDVVRAIERCLDARTAAAAS